MSRPARLITDIWNGRLPLARVFWEYAILYGSFLNLVTTLAAFATFAGGASPVLGLLMFFVPAPYNLLMVVGVWRSAGQYPGPTLWATLARALIIVWAAVATFA